MTSLAVEEVKTRDGLEPYREEWRELVHSARGSFFASDLYVLSYLDSEGRGRPMRFIFVREEGRLNAVIPFVYCRAPTGWCRGANRALPLDSGLPGSILARGSSDDALVAAFGYLAESYPGLGLSFHHLEVGSEMAQAAKRAGQRTGLSFTERRVQGNCVLRLEGSWEEYLAARTRHVRNEMKRKVRRLESAGNVRRVTAASPEETEAAMTDVLRIDERSWKHAAETSLPANRLQLEMFRHIVSRGARRGATRIHLIYLDDTPISYVLSVIHEGRYYALKTSYDESFRSLSPGVAIFEFVLRHAFGEHLEELQFLGIESRWKNEMATDVRQQMDCCVYSPRRLRCRTCAAYYEAFLPTVKAVVPHWSTVKTALRRLRADQRRTRS